MRGDARGWPVREGCLLTVHTLCESSISLEGNCSMDRVRRRRLLTPFQEGEKSKFCKQGAKLDYSRYSLYHFNKRCCDYNYS